MLCGRYIALGREKRRAKRLLCTHHAADDSCPYIVDVCCSCEDGYQQNAGVCCQWRIGGAGGSREQRTPSGADGAAQQTAAARWSGLEGRTLGAVWTERRKRETGEAGQDRFTSVVLIVDCDHLCSVCACVHACICVCVCVRTCVCSHTTAKRGCGCFYDLRISRPIGDCATRPLHPLASIHSRCV